MSAARQTTQTPGISEGKPASGRKQESFDFDRAASVLVDAAVRAGAAIMRHYREGPEVALKADASPVTRADRDSEEILLAALADLAPDVPVVAEETASDRSADPGRRFFLVDPLDGTKEFIQKRSDFTVNVALVDDGRPRFGLVYAPATGLLALTRSDESAVETNVAPNDAGADFSTLDLKPICTRFADPAALVAVVSHSHLDAATEQFLKIHPVAARSSAGSSLKFLLLARGEADVYPRFGPTMEWDTAAGQAVLEAAGGIVLNSEGGPLRYGKTEAGLKNPGFIAWGRSPDTSPNTA